MTQELFNELVGEFWQTAGVMTFSQVAIKAMNDQIAWTTTEKNPDPTLFIGAGDPNDPAAVADASWRKSQIEGAASADGWLQQWLTHAWLALMFARWGAAAPRGSSARHVRGGSCRRRICIPIIDVDVHRIPNSATATFPVATPAMPRPALSRGATPATSCRSMLTGAAVSLVGGARTSTTKPEGAKAHSCRVSGCGSWTQQIGAQHLQQGPRPRQRPARPTERNACVGVARRARLKPRPCDRPPRRGLQGRFRGVSPPG